MSNTWLNIILAFCAFTGAALSFVDQIPTRPWYNFIRTIKFKIGTLAFATILGVWATIQKDNLAEANTLREKETAQQEQVHRDTLNQQRTDSSTTMIIQTFTKSLIEYGLKYDTAQKAIEKIVQDSLRRTTNIDIHHGPDPTFGLCPQYGIKIDKQSHNKILIKFTYCYQNAPAQIQLYVSLIGADSTQFHLIDRKYNLFGNSNFDFTSGEEFFTKHLVQDTLPSTRYLFHIIGTYRSHDLAKPFPPIDFIYMYDWKHGMSVPLHPLDKVIKKMFAQLDTAQIKILPLPKIYTP